MKIATHKFIRGRLGYFRDLEDGALEICVVKTRKFLHLPDACETFIIHIWSEKPDPQEMSSVFCMLRLSKTSHFEFFNIFEVVSNEDWPTARPPGPRQDDVNFFSTVSSRIRNYIELAGAMFIWVTVERDEGEKECPKEAESSTTN